MFSERLPAWLRLTILGGATAGLLYLCLAPSDEVPQVHLWDKAKHVAGWAALTGVGLALFPRRRWAVACYALGVGLAVEVMQALFTRDRQGDWRDWIADAAGVAAIL